MANHFSILALGTPWTVWKGKKIEHWKTNVPGAQYATGEEWRNNSRKNEETEPKQKHHTVVDVTGNGSKVQCCKEYCIGSCNVTSMNQGKLKLVKQEMARVNIDILRISELKWTGMGEFNKDDHYIYYFGQESLRRNGVAIMVNKSLICSTLMQSKNDRMISVHFQGKPFNITVIQVYAPTSKAEEAEVKWFFYKTFRTNTQKRCPFHYRGLECKSRKSRNIWSNRKIWPGSTEWSRAKANRVCQ